MFAGPSFDRFFIGELRARLLALPEPRVSVPLDGALFRFRVRQRSSRLGVGGLGSSKLFARTRGPRLELDERGKASALLIFGPSQIDGSGGA